MGRRRRNNDIMSRKISRAGFIFGGKNEKLSKGLGEGKPLKFRFKMTSFKDIQTLLPLFHDDGLIDDDEFLSLYDLYSSTNPDFPYHIYPAFDHDELDESECLAKFRFRKRDIVVTLKERPKLSVSSDTIPDDSDDPGACSKNAAPEKKLHQIRQGQYSRSS